MREKRIVLIENRPEPRDFLTSALINKGYAVHPETTGHNGLRKALTLLPDMVILNISLPDLDGAEICRELKKHTSTAHIPTLILVADSELTRLTRLEARADDYLISHFTQAELLFRIGLILKRSEKTADNAPAVLQAAGVTLSLASHHVAIDGKPVSLTATEFRLLANLLRHKGGIRTREQLLSQVWGYSFKGYARTVDTHIRRLRRKLEAYAGLVETIRGVGYRFKHE